MSASEPPCTTRDLGAFEICVPPGWTLKQGGIDSAAGLFTGDKVRLSYDFGLNADPLSRLPEGATEVTETSPSVDGLPARQVAYRLPSTAPAARYLGLHVPGVRSTSRGALRLTLLAEGSDAASLKQAQTALATIRFKPAKSP